MVAPPSLHANGAATTFTLLGILVTLKTAWSKVPYVRKVIFSGEGGDDITFGSVETLSDPRPQKVCPTFYFTQVGVE